MLLEFWSVMEPVVSNICGTSRLSCTCKTITRIILQKTLGMCKQYLDLSVAPADAAFGLMADYDADPHPSKVSMIAGAYRDENGLPWVLPSVQKVCRYPPLSVFQY